MKRTVSEEELKELLKFDDWQCEICSHPIRIELSGAHKEFKIGVLREHLKKHAFPWRDPNNETINDFWMFTGVKKQKPFIK
jgi:hypothetical protein